MSSHSKPFQNLLLNPGRRATTFPGSGYVQAPAQVKNSSVPIEPGMSATSQEAPVAQTLTSERVNWTTFPNEPHRENNASTKLLANAQQSQPRVETSFENALGLSQMGGAVSSHNIYDFPSLSIPTAAPVPLPTPYECLQAQGPIVSCNDGETYDTSQGNSLALTAARTERMVETRRDEISNFGFRASGFSSQRSGTLVSWFNPPTDTLGNSAPSFQPCTQGQEAHYIPNHQDRRLIQPPPGPLYYAEMDPARNSQYPNMPIQFINPGALTQTPSQPFGSQAVFQPILRYPKPVYCNSNSNAMNWAVSQPVGWVQHPTGFYYDNNSAFAARRARQAPASHLSNGDRMYAMAPRIPLNRPNRGASVPSVTQRSQELHRANRYGCPRPVDACDIHPTSSADLRSLSQRSGVSGGLGSSRLDEKRRHTVSNPLRPSALSPNRRGGSLSAKNRPLYLSPERRRAARMAKLRTRRFTSNRTEDDRSPSSTRSSSPARPLPSRPTRIPSFAPSPIALKRKRDPEDEEEDDDSEVEASESELVPKQKKRARTSGSEVRAPFRCSPKNLNGWSFTGECEPRDDASRRKALKYSLFKEHSESGRKLEVKMFIRCQYPHVDDPAEPCLELIECEASDPGRYLRHLKIAHRIKKEDVLEEKTVGKKGKGAKGKKNDKERKTATNEQVSAKKKYVCQCLIPVGEPRAEVDENEGVIFVYDSFTRCTSTLCDDSAFQEHLYHGMHRLQGIEEVVLEDGRVYRIGLEEMYKIGCPGCPKVNDRHFGASCDNLKKHVMSNERSGCKAMTVINRDWDNLPAMLKLV